MCLSNMLCEGDVVELFDSIHTNREVDNTTKQQAATILCCQSLSFSIRVINVQQQEKGNTCGLFAIAMAFDLCEGKDRRIYSYKTLYPSCMQLNLTVVREFKVNQWRRQLLCDSLLSQAQGNQCYTCETV